MSRTYGHLTGQLTGFFDRGQLALTANTKAVADTVRELFAQSSAPEIGGDGQ